MENESLETVVWEINEKAEGKNAAWFAGLRSGKASQKPATKENTRNCVQPNCSFKIDPGAAIRPKSKKTFLHKFGNLRNQKTVWFPRLRAASKLPNDLKLSDDSCVARVLPKQEM